MDIETLKTLLSTPSDLIKAIEATRDKPEADLYFEPENHAVNDKVKRKDKTVLTPIPGEYDADNNPKTQEKIEPVSRITLSLQKLIIDQGVAIATAVPIQIESKPAGPVQETMVNMVEKTWRDNKVSYKDSEIMELTMRDKECAEVWYSEEVDPTYWEGVGSGKFKMRMKVIAPSKGDTLYPLFNAEGDMISFARGFETKDGDKEVFNMDLYTDSAIYKYVKKDKEWEQVAKIDIAYGKIPVIYHSQAKTETADVNGKIERLETLLSNHADTNDYFGSPILAASGQVLGFSAKGESGKVMELENGAKLEYVTWNSAPESIKLEIENLIKFIFDETKTLDLSPGTIKGLGALSGTALELLFLNAHLKAKKRQNGSFGEAIQRRINLLKSCMASINIGIKQALNLDITPKFGLYMPDNVTENIENITTLVNAKVLSKRTGLAQLNLVEDIDAEMDLIKAETDSLGVD